MAADEKLLILLKAPVRGMVKTRLAETVGSDAALAIYKQLLSKVLAEVASLADVELHFTPAAGQNLISPLLRPGWRHQPQVEGHLGERMHQAFSHSFLAGTKRAVIIGTDCPEYNLADIRAAWGALADHDLVLGPATDGGYWLIGLNQPQPDLFHAINWSTSTVLSETLARAKQLGLHHHLLRTLSDVDTKEDWEAYQSRKAAQTLE